MSYDFCDEDFRLEEPVADSRKYVPSRDELAQVLGCATITVARMLHEPGNPGRRANGSYNVAEWKDYYRERADRVCEETFPSSQKSELAEARIRRERARASREELLLEQTRRVLIPANEVREKWSELWSAMKEIFFRRFVLSSRDRAQAQANFSRAIEEVHVLFHSAERKERGVASCSESTDCLS